MSLLTSLRLAGIRIIGWTTAEQGSTSARPTTRARRARQITQIYEGTNQIQRVVMARRLLDELEGR
jgi:alkylation response protein AidB-like acyl-CoA dehydrogenase